MDDHDHHHHSHHEDLESVIHHDEIPHTTDDRSIDLDQHESRKRLAFDEFPDEYDDDDDDDEESAKRRRKNAPPPKKLNEDQWAEMFARLIRYNEEHGDCLVPKRYHDDPKLGTWVETQRVQYKKLQQLGGESITPNNRLNAERLEKLESVGFAWSAKNMRKSKVPVASLIMSPMKKKPPMPDHISRAQARQRVQDQTWNEMYERLMAYKAKYGDCLVPKKFEEDPKLASWVESQRMLYNRDYKTLEPRSNLYKHDASDSALMYPTSSDCKTPEEWAVEMEKGTTATEEDAAEVAATMAEATMEVVDDVVAPMDETTIDEMAADATSDTDAGLDSPYGDMNEVMSDNMLQQVKRLSQERKEKLDAVGFVWSLRSKRVDDHWDQMFNQLKEYKAHHGDCLVPSRYELNHKLGKWVETQRYEYTKLQRLSSNSEREDCKPGTNPRLTAERRARLEAIGFEWKVKHKMKRYYDRQWDSMFDKLLQFKAENGHCLVPKRYPPDFKLGTWVHTQRIQFRKLMAVSGKKDETMTNEDEFFGEEAKRKAEEQMAQDEADMKAAVDSLVVGAEHDENRLLESAERQDAEDQFFRLTEERRRRLDDVGFVWSARDSEKNTEPSRITRNSYDDQWDSMFLRLKEYKDRNGHCLVPKRCKEDQKLGTWVDTQRVQYKKMRKKLDREGLDYVPPKRDDEPEDLEGDFATKKPLVGRLTDDRIRRLESLGFVWSLRDDWQKHYEELVHYKEEHGNCNVPARYTKNRRLGIWVSAQRQQYKQITSAVDDDKPKRATPLTQERIDLLNALGFTWTLRSRDSLGESWNQRLEELKQYKERYGTCLVPTRYLPNPELGMWVGTQRTQYRLFQQSKQNGIPNSSSMSEDRVRQLEDLGFSWNVKHDKDGNWKQHVAELEEFFAIHGHGAVPGNYRGNPGLGEWAMALREAWQSGESDFLDEERISELNSLHFSWQEPSEDSSDMTNNKVTITSIVSGEDHDVALEPPDIDPANFTENSTDSGPFSHSPGLHDIRSDILIREAIEHAEI